MAVTYRLYYCFDPPDPFTLRTPGVYAWAGDMRALFCCELDSNHQAVGGQQLRDFAADTCKPDLSRHFGRFAVDNGRDHKGYVAVFLGFSCAVWVPSECRPLDSPQSDAQTLIYLARVPCFVVQPAR